MAPSPSAPPATPYEGVPKSSTFDPFWDRLNHSINSNDDPEVEAAIRTSLQEAAAKFGLGTQHNLPRPSNPPMKDLSMDLVLHLNNDFLPLEDPDGDTAVYMGAPPKAPEQTEKDYVHIKKHFDRLFIIQSANLRLMGEHSRFHTLLGPMSVRAERRLRKTGILALPEARRGSKFKYYIDLKPVSEDEEAIILLTDLTCTKGVLNWHLAQNKYGLNPYAVMGYDDFGPPPPLLPLDKTEAQKTTGSFVEDGSSQRNPAPESRRESSATSSLSRAASSHEYSQLRHWSAVERLLNAIEGRDPRLDSAPKVWTFFALAKHFGCAHHERISGWITTWIYQCNNENFIQCNPEVAYRIGMGIASVDLVKDAFSILVGERALLVAFKEFNPMTSNDVVNVHQRKLESLDDDELNRIDHAASSLVQRIRNIVYSLCSKMDWLRECDEYARLATLVGHTKEEEKIIEHAKTTIQDFIRGRIYYVVCQDQKRIDALEASITDTAAFREGSDAPFEKTYNTLNQSMRVFTKTFWTALGQTKFNLGYSNTSWEGTIGNHAFTFYAQALKDHYPLDPLNGIRCISRKEFDDAIGAVNDILRGRDITSSFVLRGLGPSSNPLGDALDVGHQSHEAGKAVSGHPDLQDFTHLATNLNDTASWTTHEVEADAVKSGVRNNTDMDPREPIGPDSPSKRRKTIEEQDFRQSSLNEITTGESSAEVRRTPGTTGVGAENLSPQDARITTNDLGKHRLPFRSLSSVGKGGTGLVKPLQAKEEGVRKSKDYWWNWKQSSKESPQTATKSVGESGNTATQVPHPNVPNSGATKIAKQVSSEDRRTEKQWSDEAWKSKERAQHRYHYIDAKTFLRFVNEHVSQLSSTIINPPHLFHSTGMLPTNLFDVLLCLDDEEFKYLPLWAGGNDDGTGGVYDDFPLPVMDDATVGVEAFRPGRIRKGHDAPSESDSGSSFEDIATSQALSTVGRASKDATDGTETVVSLSTVSSVSDTRSVRKLFGGVTLTSVDDDDADNDGHMQTGEYGDACFNSGDDFSDNEVEVGEDYDEGDEEEDDDNDTIGGDMDFDEDISSTSRRMDMSLGLDHDGGNDDGNNKNNTFQYVEEGEFASVEKGKQREVPLVQAQIQKLTTSIPTTKNADTDDMDEDFEMI